MPSLRSNALSLRLSLALSLTLAPAALGACSDDAGPPPQVGDDFRRLGENLGPTIASMKSSATTTGSVVPADLASVAHVPKDVTGGVDIGVQQSGKTGEKAANIDGVGGDEAVSVFVPDVKSGSGTTASLPSFAAWRDGAGLCYLGFTKGASWFVVSRCGEGSGAWVCQVTGTNAECNACNGDGDCTPCDLTQSKLTCAWP